MIAQTLTIATRESPLALWQANWVKARLEELYPAINIHLLGITTSADKQLEVSLTKIGGKGLFVKELEEALLDGRADIAVHSMKDVPMVLPEGLSLQVMCQREEPRDAFISNDYDNIHDLPAGAVLGTSSLRRQSQLYALRQDIRLIHIRGNVNTRLTRLDQGEFAGLILAAAGLRRLNLQQRIRFLFNTTDMLPAAGQGVLGIECRIEDVPTQTLIAPLNDAVSFACVTAERALCQQLGGSCQVPIGAYAECQDHTIFLRGLVARPDGTQLLRAEDQAPFDHPIELGLTVAKKLRDLGAADILEAIKSE